MVSALGLILRSVLRRRRFGGTAVFWRDGPMRRILAATFAAVAIGGLPAAAPAHRAQTPQAVAAKTCSSSFKHARINGVQKCLRVGEFCAHRFDHRAPHRYSYKHYGYACTKQDSRGNYHLTRR